MKKTKSILLTSVTVVMALIMSLAVGCSGGSSCKKKPTDDDKGTKTLQSITLDTSAVKTEYFVGEDLSTEGLVVTANYVNENNETSTETVALNDRNLAINTAAYKKDVAGTYIINVTFRNSGVQKSDSYAVNVLIEHKGLNVVLKDSAPKSIELSTENKTADLSDAANWIEVRKVDKRGNVDMTAAPLAASDYTVEIYLGKTKLTGEQLKSCKMGAYQIWAYTEDYATGAFANVNVYDTLVSIAFKNGTRAQSMGGVDMMSPTWTYTATFVSGETKDLTAKDVTVAGVNPMTVTANGSATVSYKYRNDTKTVSVPYEIRELKGLQTYTATYYVAGTDGSTTTEWEELIGSSDQLSISISSSNRREENKTTEDGETSFQYNVEFKASAQITINMNDSRIKAGSVTMTFYISHGSSNTTRTATLLNGSTDMGHLAITGSGTPPVLYALTVSNLSKGNYSLTASDTMRFYAVVVTYTVDYGGVTE